MLISYYWDNSSVWSDGVIKYYIQVSLVQGCPHFKEVGIEGFHYTPKSYLIFILSLCTIIMEDSRVLLRTFNKERKKNFSRLN